MKSNNFTFSAAPDSTAISGIAYTSTGGALALIMESGTVLLYLGVPRFTATGLMGADSVGSFFNKEIRNKYRYLRVGTLHPEETPSETGSRSNCLFEIAAGLKEAGVSPAEIRRVVSKRNSLFEVALSEDEVEAILADFTK